MSEIAYLEQWASTILAPAHAVAGEESEGIARAGKAIAERIAADGRLMTLGAGHSWCVAAEFCSRAGGLPSVVAMSLEDIAPRRDQWMQMADSLPERDPALAKPMMDHHHICAADAVLIVTNSARNGMLVEFAKLASEIGCLVVVITSLAHLASVPSRHPSGKKVVDYADIILDNHGVSGDASVEVAPTVWMGSTSTIAGTLMAQLLSCDIGQRLAGSGEFQSIRSANLD